MSTFEELSLEHVEVCAERDGLAVARNTYRRRAHAMLEAVRLEKRRRESDVSFSEWVALELRDAAVALGLDPERTGLRDLAKAIGVSVVELSEAKRSAAEAVVALGAATAERDAARWERDANGSEFLRQAAETGRARGDALAAAAERDEALARVARLEGALRPLVDDAGGYDISIVRYAARKVEDDGGRPTAERWRALGAAARDVLTDTIGDSSMRKSYRRPSFC